MSLSIRTTIFALNSPKHIFDVNFNPCECDLQRLQINVSLFFSCHFNVFDRTESHQIGLYLIMALFHAHFHLNLHSVVSLLFKSNNELLQPGFNAEQKFLLIFFLSSFCVRYQGTLRGQNRLRGETNKYRTEKVQTVPHEVHMSVTSFLCHSHTGMNMLDPENKCSPKSNRPLTGTKASMILWEE